MKEEDNITKKLGKENPFRVPEGYFEGLTSGVMEHLPEREDVVPDKVPATSTWTKLKPFLYLAAMFVGAALILRVASTSTDRKATTPSTAVASTAATVPADSTAISDEMLDMALNRAMLDDYSLYVYLSDASAE
ncbi:MAG: hypothetical protein LBN24_00160 [Mediterranea sp.]|jgi:hypothetical protein|nr:hypothetical protein [Mediterranea sp.]